MEKDLLFCAKDITKNFQGTQALKGVDLEVYQGEVVGLVGENGAGKSTLLKIIIGIQSQSSGEMTLHGKPFSPKDPMQANAQGIGMVFQEQSLVVNLTVGQNIFFGHEKQFRQCGLVNWSKMYRQAQKALDKVGAATIPAKKKVSALNFAARQMVEIAKVVNVAQSSGHEHCLILLDEPTSVLNEEEVQKLFVEIRKLTQAGHSVVFISHRLDEILSITDRIYVYKDGQSVGTIPTHQATEAVLYEMMVGSSTSTEYYKLDQQSTPRPEVALAAERLSLRGVFKDVSFQLHAGEVLGFCGVVGSGKEEICSVLCGDERPTSGTLYLHGRPQALKSPAEALTKGILMIPKERLVEGIVASLSVADNMAFSNLKSLRRGLLVSKKEIVKQAKQWIEALRIKTSSHQSMLLELSGGNQQKVVFARALASQCDILILNHPTRGVDVGAKEEIYSLVREMTKAGKSVIILGDTLDECIGLSNRIMVMKDGVVTGEFDAAVNHKPEQVEIVSLMM